MLSHERDWQAVEKKKGKNKSYLQIKMMMVMSADQPEPCGETKKIPFSAYQGIQAKIYRGNLLVALTYFTATSFFFFSGTDILASFFLHFSGVSFLYTYACACVCAPALCAA